MLDLMKGEGKPISRGTRLGARRCHRIADPHLTRRYLLPLRAARATMIVGPRSVLTRAVCGTVPRPEVDVAAPCSPPAERGPEVVAGASYQNRDQFAGLGADGGHHVARVVDRRLPAA